MGKITTHGGVALYEHDVLLRESLYRAFYTMNHVNNAGIGRL